VLRWGHADLEERHVTTDSARATIEVDAPLDRVLATLRDVGSQPAWVREVRSAVVLETNDDGTPARARFTAGTPVGTDEYTLAYVHVPDGVRWSLVEGRLQTGQDASYRLRPLGRDRTEVTFELLISHSLPLPGFLRRKVIKDLVSGNLAGLKEYVES
jgi:uncharacterized membrane protein